MTGVIKNAIGNAIGALDSAVTGTERAAEAIAQKIGDKILGPTAESDYRNAQAIAPEASSTEPILEGHRSTAPDGSDPYRAVASEPDAKA